MADNGTFKPPAKMSNRERDELLKKGTPFQPPIPQTIIQTQETQTTITTNNTQPSTPKETIQQSETSPATIQNKEEHEAREKTIPATKQDKEEDEAIETIVTPARSFLCEKCKWCDGFEPSYNEKQICRICKCDLIFHIDVIEEEDDEAEEYSSDEDVWNARDEISYNSD